METTYERRYRALRRLIHIEHYLPALAKRCPPPVRFILTAEQMKFAERRFKNGEPLELRAPDGSICFLLPGAQEKI